MVKKEDEISYYWPASFPQNNTIKYIAFLNKQKPVHVFWNNYATRNEWHSSVINLFTLVKLYNKYIPLDEDWYVAYSSGFSVNEDIRNRNIRKYTKALVVEMLKRLCSHKKIRHFAIDDIILNSWDGESDSFFKPYKTIHVDFFF